MPRDETGVQFGGREGRMSGQRLEEPQVGSRSDHLGACQSVAQPPHRRRAILAPDHQLGDHRVVVKADAVALPHAGLEPETVVLVRKAQARQISGRRQKVTSRVFRVEPNLDGVTADAQRVLGKRQRGAVGDPELPFHQILTGDHLGHRMLDL